MSATITVEWDYDSHSITLTDQEWNTVKEGDLLLVKGEGYYHEDELFQDYWQFDGGLNGSLIVTYGEDGGTGFDGNLADATIQE